MAAAMLLWSSMADASPLAAFAPYAIAGIALLLVYAVLVALLKPKAKLERRPLLTKGDDFPHIDLGWRGIIRAEAMPRRE
ncbi:hypothetical protein [Aureimonas sp. AU20]|uniref:hypothetical protein n=1 Tax=Aureimonas sp. AU20 TaxID=1349819 RepID=UPI0011DFB19E|nr:hypothetical protein [Aureimonas sp. AU20]